MKLDDFLNKYEYAVAVSDRVARAAGYGEQVTNDMKLEVAHAWRDAVAEYEMVTREILAAIARAGLFIGDVGTLSERVDRLRKAVEKGKAEEYKRAQLAADAQWRRA